MKAIARISVEKPATITVLDDEDNVVQTYNALNKNLLRVGQTIIEKYNIDKVTVLAKGVIKVFAEPYAKKLSKELGIAVDIVEG